MVNIFIIHGSYGEANENWFPWLKSELEKLGHHVFVPNFPTPEGQSLESWKNVFHKYENDLDKNSILIGHSLGPVFILDLLEHHSVKAAFFISGFLGKLNNPDFDKVNETFIDRNFDWVAIKTHCNYFFQFHSDNDPYVPLAKAQELAEKLGIKLEIIKNGGHFNSTAGYKQFQLLLERIKNVI